MKENIKSVVVLTAICLVVAVLLAFTNSVTAPIIEANQAAAANESLLIVMPEATGFEELTASLTLPETVSGVYKENSGLGFVMTLNATSDYSGGNPMTFTIAIDATGAISAVELTGYYESKDFGAEYPQSYVGQNSTLADVTLVAGCTYSSVAFKNTIADAFTVLIENNLVAEAQKSEEQLISEAMPIALPGACDSLGNIIASAIDPVAPATQAFKAGNGCGYVFVMPSDAGTVVVGVNAFGVAKVVDLEGNDITASAADVAATASGLLAPLATENLEANLNTATAAVEEGAVITPVEGLALENNVIAAFKAETSTGVQYIVISQPYGFGNHGMKMLHVFAEDGSVVVYKSLGSLILEAEYYSAHQLTDEAAYKNQYIGVTESTFSDDAALVAGATVTGNAVNSSFHSAFEAFNLIKEGVA